MQHVTPQDIPKHWEFVESGLKQIIRRTGEKWTPTHILQALHLDHARLFVSEDGFFVLQPCREEWTAAPYVNVWAMWWKAGKAAAIRKTLRDWLDDMTGKRAKFSSPRMGWKVLEPDWEIERITWRRK